MRSQLRMLTNKPDWLNGSQRDRFDPSLLQTSWLRFAINFQQQRKLHFLFWCTRIPLIPCQILVMAVVVRRHLKRGPYGRVYWEDSFRKHTSCGICCGRQWWTSWGGWGKRRPSAALLAGGVDNDVSQWCKERAAVHIYLQRARAALFFLFLKPFCSDCM